MIITNRYGVLRNSNRVSLYASKKSEIVAPNPKPLPLGAMLAALVTPVTHDDHEIRPRHSIPFGGAKPPRTS